MSDSSTDVTRNLVVGFTTEFNCAQRVVRTIRKSDGQEIDRRPMRSDEVEQRCAKKETTSMQLDQLIGKKFNALTIKAVEGSDARHNKLCSVECDCGEVQGGIILSQVSRGVKKYCDARRCPIAQKERGKRGK